MTIRRVYFLLLFALGLLLSVKCHAQTPDCTIPFTFTGAGSSPSFDNRSVACFNWTIQYESTGFSVVTLTFQSATGAVSAGSFGTYAGTVSTGSNPMTSTTGATSTFTNGTVSIPWVRMNLTITGSGTVRGTLYGYKSGYGSGSGGGGGGCPGTVGTPCVVDGPTASGSAATKPPVMVAGIDGTNVRTLATDTSGNVKVIGGVAAGAASPNPIVTGASNSSSNNVTDFICDSTAAISISASGLTQIIPLTSGKQIHICHISFSSSASSDVTIEYGTGSNCGTGTTAVSGAYKAVVTLALDFQMRREVVTPASNAVCLNFGTSVTAGGLAVYAVF